MDHPSIIKLYEIFESDKWVFLVQEYDQLNSHFNPTLDIVKEVSYSNSYMSLKI